MRRNSAAWGARDRTAGPLADAPRQTLDRLDMDEIRMDMDKRRVLQTLRRSL